MNELIEKLLDEAELDIVWNQDNPDYKWVEGSEESLLKFAELLVRECMSKTAGYLLEDEFGGPDVKEASEELAKYFGVEQ